MKIGRVFPELLRPLAAAASLEAGLDRTVRRIVRLTGAAGGLLVFRPPRGSPIVVTAGARLPRTLGAWLGGVTAGRASRRPPVPRLRVVRVALGAPGHAVGELVLVAAPRGRKPAVPAGFPRELGAALEQVWRAHHRTLRMQTLNEVTALLVSRGSLDEVFSAFADSVARLVHFDGFGIELADPERGTADVVDVLARGLPGVPPRDVRIPVAGTLLERVMATGTPVRIADAEAGVVPEIARTRLAAAGYRSAVLVPLASPGGVFGAVCLAARAAHAFDETDVEIAAELARPLASAVEQRRLLDETQRRADELSALDRTSRLITARLDLASVLDRINRSVTALIDSTGCGIGLVDEEKRFVVHAAAHGFKSDEWRALAMPVGEGIIGRCAEMCAPVRVDDVRTDARSARRDVDEQEGMRSMLCVPMMVGGQLLGVISAFSTRPAAFGAHHQRVLELFGEQAGIAIHNAQLFEDSVRRARETRALLGAGRAVTASLDVEQTIRVILEEARSVLGVESCGLMTVDPVTDELVSMASLDLPQDLVAKVRLKPGEGITGRAVAERRPVQSADLWNDPQVLFPELPKASGLRSMLAVPLCLGDRAIGALVALRRDVHTFPPGEEELLMALADQAAIALDHARLYREMEARVRERTRQLDDEKRFVEVVVETLPLGVFVLDAALAVVRANRAGTTVLRDAAAGPRAFRALLPDDKADDVEAFLRETLREGTVRTLDDEMLVAGRPRVLRLTAAPLAAPGEAPGHVVVLVDDITRAKRLERQMVLVERLTTAGRLAAGVAHELNNPLATIAGCAEALLERTRTVSLDGIEELTDLRSDLATIEE